MSSLRPWSTFDTLVRGIGEVDRAAVLAVGRQAQQMLSLRNWIFGTWIVQFEQGGEDRAAYGEKLLDRLSAALEADGRRGLSARNLRNFRQVALAYPGLQPDKLAVAALASGVGGPIWQAPAKSVPATGASELPWRDTTWLRRLFTELTFTHLLELARIDDPTERAFYELHSLKERWAVRELIRQRNTLLYQRVGLSTERDAVLALAREGQIDERPAALIRDPLVLEFLGLGSDGPLDESQLEDAMLAHLQQFLVELGREFCFVGRQVRITIGNRHHYLDLLFFHRRLRCLVAIELKTTEFEPAHYGQMSFYLNYLAAEETLEGENPPIGILLCSSKDEESVHYTVPPTASVVVARYLLELPKEDQLKQWLHEARVATERQIWQAPARSSEDDAG